MLTDGETGVLVAPGDHRAQAAVLTGLSEDPDRRAELGRRAARDVRSRFSRAALLHATQALYDRLLS
jgi:glycosyltransferase involved in cell wall biosynthesis